MANQSENVILDVRRKAIAEMIAENGVVSVASLCDKFNVSPATVRNDLRELERIGALKRTHGGAVTQQQTIPEPYIYDESIPNLEEKKAIAQAAIAFVQPGDTIAIDIGSTSFEFAKLLNNIENLNIVTNDIRIAAYLERNTNMSIILAGGTINMRFHCTTGQTVLNTISGLYVDKVFITADGINMKKGLSSHDMEIASFKASLIDSGDKVFLLADHSKMGKNSFVFYAGLSKVDVLITDERMPEEFKEPLQQSSMEIIYAKVNRH